MTSKMYKKYNTVSSGMRIIQNTLIYCIEFINMFNVVLS